MAPTNARDPRRRGSLGSVTAEVALALPSVVIALGVVICVGQVVSAQLQCVDAAREAARYAARGEPGDRVSAVVRAVGPAGAQVGVDQLDQLVRVRVSTQVRLALPGFPAITVSGQSIARLEPTGAG